MKFLNVSCNLAHTSPSTLYSNPLDLRYWQQIACARSNENRVGRFQILRVSFRSEI